MCPTQPKYLNTSYTNIDKSILIYINMLELLAMTRKISYKAMVSSMKLTDFFNDDTYSEVEII